MTDSKIIESGEHLGIKWEISQLNSAFYQNQTEDVFCRIYSNVELPNTRFFYNSHKQRLFKSNPKKNDSKKIIFDEIEKIHNYILAQYDPGGEKYLESERKISSLS